MKRNYARYAFGPDLKSELPKYAIGLATIDKVTYEF